MPPLYTHTWTGYESYSTRGLYIIPSTGVCMYFRTAGIVGAQKGATGRQGTRSHFQVGFRTARPLEGTSNDSDIAAREFKSLTPSGSLSTYTYRLSLTLSIHMCARIHTRTYIYIYLSLFRSRHRWLDLRREGGKKYSESSVHRPFSPSPLLIKYSIGRSISSRFARVETECIRDRRMGNSVLSKGFIIVIFLVGGVRSLEIPIKLIFSGPRRENKSGTDWIEFAALLSRSVDVREGWF